MKTRNCIVSLMTSALLASCANTYATPHETTPLTLWVITDLHYLSPKLFDASSASFQALLETNNGKMIEQMAELLSDFRAQALEDMPDAILVSGDLTMNGEYESLLDLQAYFRAMEQDGIPVLVIPGNHDIGYPYARNLTEEAPALTRNITTEDFHALMDEFGYAHSHSHADDSFSYTYVLAEDLWVMALDDNTEAAPGSITDATLAWAEDELRYAKEHGIRVITMTHQNVLKQSDFLYQGYIINNASEVEEMLKRYGVSLNLSGHSHLQHTAVSNGLTDICTECASVWPMGFGVVSIAADHNNLTYTKQSFRVDQTQAEQRLDETTARMIRPALLEKELSEETLQALTSFAQEVNKAYYTGQLSDSTPYLEREDWQLWRRYAGDTMWYLYLQQVLSEFQPH